MNDENLTDKQLEEAFAKLANEAKPSKDFDSMLQAKLADKFKELQADDFQGAKKSSIFQALFFRPRFAGALAAILFISTTTTYAYTSDEVVNGDILYPVKRTIEKIEETISSDKVAVYGKMADRRVRELEVLAGMGREDRETETIAQEYLILAEESTFEIVNRPQTTLNVVSALELEIKSRDSIKHRLDLFVLDDFKELREEEDLRREEVEERKEEHREELEESKNEAEKERDNFEAKREAVMEKEDSVELNLSIRNEDTENEVNDEKGEEPASTLKKQARERGLKISPELSLRNIKIQQLRDRNIQIIKQRKSISNGEELKDERLEIEEREAINDARGRAEEAEKSIKTEVDEDVAEEPEREETREERGSLKDSADEEPEPDEPPVDEDEGFGRARQSSEEAVNETLRIDLELEKAADSADEAKEEIRTPDSELRMRSS